MDYRETPRPRHRIRAAGRAGERETDMNSMDKTREFLKSIGLPGGDAYDLPTSSKRFADGGQYRFEVPGIQGPKVMKALLEAMDSYGLYLHRVTQTQGIMRLTDEDIAKMVELAHEYETDLILAIGPLGDDGHFRFRAHRGRSADGLPPARPGADRPRD